MKLPAPQAVSGTLPASLPRAWTADQIAWTIAASASCAFRVAWDTAAREITFP
ncbi:MAG: hypothetical protein ACRDNS_04080 [Trebonia sp.]